MSDVHHIDRKANPPTVVGQHGEAWLLDQSAVRDAFGVKEEADGTVCLWYVFAPWAHPWWSYYAISVVHLRPQPGLPPPKFKLPGATHEIVVAAMDPSHVPSMTGKPRTWLHPLNFAGQWIVGERPNPVDLDRGAYEKIRGIVDEILAGRLSPDTDFRHEWVKRFTDSNLAK